MIQFWTAHLTTPELPQPLFIVRIETCSLRNLKFYSFLQTLFLVYWIWYATLTDSISWFQMTSVVKASFVLKPMQDFDAELKSCRT